MTLRARRRKILGVPVGRRRRSMPGVGWAGAGAAAAVATVPLAQKAGRALSHGRELAGQAEQAVDTARNVRDAVSSHSSTIGKVGAVIGEVRKLGKSEGEGKPRLSHLIEEHTDIAAPRRVVYNQWTQMEMFPAIVKGVEAVDQEDDDRAEWTSKIGPVRRHWEARITEQVPDELIAWKSEGGPRHEGVVSFHSLDEQLTRVLIQMQYKPSGPLETVGNTLRIQRRRVRRDLRMFKHFVELSNEETGAWRGRIDGSDSSRSGSQDEDGSAGGRSSSRSGSRSSSRASGRSNGGSSGRASGRSNGPAAQDGKASRPPARRAPRKAPQRAGKEDRS